MGLKVFDVYGELHLDRDVLRKELKGLPATVGPDADRAGQDLGRKITDGLTRAVEASSARLTKARREETKATDAVKLAELRLNEARESGKAKASQLLALEQKLTQSSQRLADANNATTLATNKHAEAQRRLAQSIADVGKNAGPAADKAGQDLGGKLSQGIHLSIVRNSPLIAAAIGGALAVGGPAVLVGATALFAGIGIVAAAQSEKVQDAWQDVWHDIGEDAKADAAVIEPVLSRMAGRVGDAFDRMRPQLQGAFTAAAPQVEVFTDGILDLAENALPGLVRSVERGMPVTRGFADFLAKTGTGLSDFFDRISSHGPAAGEVFSSLGDIMAALLPTLGELIGQGAEVAADVLPAVAGSAKAVLTVMQALGPALPLVVNGLIAMKLAGTVGNMMGSLATQGQKAAVAMTGNATAGTKTVGVLGKIGNTLPVVGAAFVLLDHAMNASDERAQQFRGGLDGLYAAMRAGGSAAEQAQADLEKVRVGIEKLGDDGIDTSRLQEAFDKAKTAARDYEESLTPIEAAQQRLSAATRTLSETMGDENASAKEVAAAQREYKAAVAENERANGDLERAIHGVTAAMVDQAQQAMAAANADYAYRQSLDSIDDDLNGITEAQRQQSVAARALADAQREHGRGSAEAAEAQRNLDAAVETTDDSIAGLEGTILAAAEAAGRMAAESSGLDEGLKRDQIQASATLTELVRLREELGVKFPPDLNRAIASLEASGAAIDGVSATSAAAGGMVRNFIGDLTTLGQQKPKPVVDANIDPLTGKTQASFSMIASIDGKRPTPVVGLNTDPFTAAANYALRASATLAGQRPTPVAGMNAGPLVATSNWLHGLVSGLDRRRANPVATLLANTATAEEQLNHAARARTATVHLRQMGAALAGGGKVGDAIRGFVGGGSPSRRSDGKLSGPGGPLEDLISARVSTGEQIHVSPTEWIIKAMSAGRYGDRRMGAVNSGEAEILIPGDARYRRPPPARALAGGGPLSPTTGTSQPAADSGMAINFQPGSVVVKFDGTYDLASSRDLRRAAQVLEQELVKLMRARS